MTVRILNGDCRDILKTLPPESVNCIVTSPPYFGLRSYGIGIENGEIGRETSPDAFVDEIVRVFQEVRRVLRTDGTCWINLGDSYANDGKWGGETGGKQAYLDDNNRKRVGREKRVTGLKPKDLMGLPWRVAFALQADGWYLRQDIIWSKPNPMPESVRDRCTKAHEYIFLLSKSERYWYDADAIAEQVAVSTVARNKTPRNRVYEDGNANPSGGGFRGTGGFCGPNEWKGNTRNRRSVWEVATQPFAEAHFATFPPALIKPCILAGCPEKVCAKCGAPWARDIEREKKPQGRSSPEVYTGQAYDTPQSQVWGAKKNLGGDPRAVLSSSIGPSCSCDAGTVPGTCLDPFGGAGTTGLVADRLGRNAILIELNPQYAAMAERRIRGDAGMFAQVNT